MLSDRDIELAHPGAFDFAFGNLPAAGRASFNRHLSSCRHCRSVVDEYGDIGAVIKTVPRTTNRRPTSRTGRSPPWLPSWPGKEPSQQPIPPTRARNSMTRSPGSRTMARAASLSAGVVTWR